ncbi:MAG: SMP-30/gluconolactonase/LRE family protein [Planctomycetales bacterium]
MIRIVALFVVLCCGLSRVYPVAAADMSLAELLPADSKWEVVSSGHEFTEGPASDAQGRVYFTDVPRSQIHRIDLDGKVSVFVGNSSGTNGLMFGPDGKLYGCQNGKKRIVAFDEKGNTETIAEGVESNDLVVTTHGAIYFTEPSKGRIWYIAPNPEKKVVAEGLRPNGVILTSDEGTLVATDGRAPHLWAFKVEVDGTLSSKIPYYALIRLSPDSETPGSDGLTLDRDGRIYVATRAGLQFFDDQGRMSGVILKPQENSCPTRPSAAPSGITCMSPARIRYIVAR